MGLFNLDSWKRRETTLKIPMVDMGLVTVLFTLTGLLGAVFIISSSIFTLGAGAAVLLFWQLGLFLSSGCVGFLFGHPRVTRPTPTEPSAPSVRAVGENTTFEAGVSAQLPRPPDRRLLDPSTSLQDIVDWLTKIIVGVGLVELRKLPDAVYRLAGVMANSVVAVAPKATAVDGLVGLSVAVIVASVGCGFVFGYLMTRMYLQGAISRADEGLTRREEQLRRRLLVSAKVPSDREVITDLYAPAMTDWDSDPNKGKFGRKSEADGWKLSAKVSPQPPLSPQNPLCEVELSVISVAGAGIPKDGSVTFHLHPSYNHPTPNAAVRNGRATLKILSWGAFTVGAEVMAGDRMTQLELNLAKVEGGTPAFYAE